MTKTILEQRIDEVLARGIFPDAKAWCLAADLSHGYIATLKTRLKQGKVTQGKSQPIQALARAAGVSTDWLMGLTSDAIAGDPFFGDFLTVTRTRPGLAEALAKHPRRWRTTTVLRATSFETPADAPFPLVTWWIGLLDGLESGNRCS